MGLLDWIDKGKRPNGITGAKVQQRLRELAAEHRHDERFGKLRDTLGREPEASEIESEPNKAACKKGQPRRVKVNSRDVPY